MVKSKIFIGFLALLFLALSINTAMAGLSSISATIQKPTNGELFNSRTNVNFTVIPYEGNATFNIANVTLYTSNVSGGNQWIANTTIAATNGTSVSWLMNFSADGTFSFNFLINSNDSISKTYNSSWASPTSNYTLSIDTANPSVTLGTPASGNNSIQEGSPIVFIFTPSDANTVSNCTLYIDSTLTQTLTSISNGASNSFSAWTSTGGDHNWYVTCIDNYANTGTSSTNALSIIRVSGSSSGGGGGGGFILGTTTTTTLLSNALPKLEITQNGNGGTGSISWTTVMWWVIGIIAGLIVLYILSKFFGLILKMAIMAGTFLLTNPVGWVISAIIIIGILILWWMW